MNETDVNQLKQSFSENYGKSIKHLYAIRPYRVYVAVTSTDCYVIKFFTEEGPLIWQARCIDQLLSKQTKGVIPFLPNKYQSVTNAFLDRFYGVMPYIPGQPIDLRQKMHILNGLKLLAHLHQQGRGIFGQPTSVPFRSQTYLKWQERLVQFKHSLQGHGADEKRGQNGLSQLVLGLADEAMEWAEQVLSAFPQSYMHYLEEQAQWARQIAHLDLTPHNLLVLEDQFFYLLDYDRLNYAPPILDLVQFLNMALPELGWDFEASLQLIQQYAAHVPMEKEERQMIPLLLVFPHDLFREWLGAWRRETGYHPERVYFYLQKVQRQWLERRRFVQSCLAMVK